MRAVGVKHAYAGETGVGHDDAAAVVGGDPRVAVRRIERAERPLERAVGGEHLDGAGSLEDDDAAAVVERHRAGVG